LWAIRYFPKARRGLPGRRREFLPLRLGNEEDQEGQDEPRRAGHQEHHLPGGEDAQPRDHHLAQALQFADQGAAGHVGAGRADRRSGGEDPQRHGQAPHREQVADDRIGRGRQAGLADADAEARQEQREEAVGQSAGRGRNRPQGHAEIDDEAARIPVHQPSDRYGEDRVEEAEGDALEQAQAEVAEPEVLLYRLDEQVDDLPVQVRDD
jgi:hypothetical protein